MTAETIDKPTNVRRRPTNCTIIHVRTVLTVCRLCSFRIKKKDASESANHAAQSEEYQLVATEQ
jgi:hypothetical protein